MQLHPRRRPRVWLDITTSKSSGKVHNGTTRIERGLIRELPACLPPGRLGFCYYSRVMSRFSTVQDPPLLDVKAGPRPPHDHSRGSFRRFLRNVERSARILIKGSIRAIAVSVRGQYSRFPTALPGDTILLAGENWSRHDFSVLHELKKNRKVHIAAVLQDMIPCIHPQFFEAGSFKTRFQAYVEFLSTSADVIFTISKSTTEDFLRFASGVSPMRIVQIELGVDVLGESTQSRPAAIAALGNRSYVLCVSTIQSRKNFDLLYRIWQRFALERQPDAPHLVVVGRPGFGSADLLYMIRNDPWIADSITLIQEASDAELGWLYAHCLFTLYPSWYEGWGLPLTESLAYGKTFIASDRSSLPEAGQGLGIHLDPYDLVSWSGELMRLANDGETRAAMEQRILAVRRVPNWSDTARKISAVLEELIYARETTTG